MNIISLMSNPLLFLCFLLAVFAEADRQVHIVYMGDKTNNVVPSAQSLHRNMINEVTGSDAASLHLVHSYKRSFNGFAAWLTDEEVKTIAKMEGVVSVFASQLLEVHTTKSWDFMGFPAEASRAVPLGSDVIIGMIDTGIWPESESFSDEGFGPPPSRWKGACHSSNFTCNNKIVGARYYRTNGTLGPGDILSARDSEGHGSHTASTAAGRRIEGASLLGLAGGTARGGLPSARIAVYKACWSDGCYDADVLAAFDDAIADGVDIISISSSGEGRRDYFSNSVAIGSFHAMRRGILTSEAAGNSGPNLYSLGNNSPWSLTVAASTIGRRFISTVRLGNGTIFEGVAVNAFGMNDTMHPLVFAGDVPNVSAGYNSSISSSCKSGSLDGEQVKGKIVICSGLADAFGPWLAGASGMVVGTIPAFMDAAFQFPIPASVLATSDARAIFQYSNTTSNPEATITKSEVTVDTAAPYVVSFSSRGPNNITRDLLKPDLTAPGVDILAAWSPMASGSPFSYNIASGTSMSCPHATGAAAYVKSVHPDWSPAAIKSALMTTAHPMKSSKNNDTEFAYGAGHLNPLGAAHPGLVYDAGVEDYIRMICGQGYSSTLLRLVTGDNSSCSAANKGAVSELNYPSFALYVDIGKPFTATFRRTVTNVGVANSTYVATISSPPQLTISMEPTTFSFGSIKEKQSFTLKIEGVTTEDVLSASLELNDGVRSVRSPIVVYTISEGKVDSATSLMQSIV